MYQEGSRNYNNNIDVKGHPSEFGFKDWIHEWKAENWNPEELIKLYADAGAKYFFSLANHHDKFALYLNMDNGSGRFRGIYLEQNDLAFPYFQAWMKPVESLGFTTLTPRNTGGTDHMTFNGVGLPAFQFIQDELEYNRTYHTMMDVSAIIMSTRLIWPMISWLPSCLRRNMAMTIISSQPTAAIGISSQELTRKTPILHIPVFCPFGR